MIHSDSHQINARWHGLPRRAHAKFFKYHYKCILVLRSVSVLLWSLISILHTPFLLLISPYDSPLAIAIQHTRRCLGDRPLSRSRCLSASLSHSVSISTTLSSSLFLCLSLLSLIRNSMLRVNIMESPRILGGFFFAAQGSKQISTKWHSK